MGVRSKERKVCSTLKMSQIGSIWKSVSRFKVAIASSFCVMVAEYFVVSLTVPLRLSFALTGRGKKEFSDPEKNASV